MQNHHCSSELKFFSSFSDYCLPSSCSSQRASSDQSSVESLKLLPWESTWLLWPWFRALWPAPALLPLSWGGWLTLSPFLSLAPAELWWVFFWPPLCLGPLGLDWLLAPLPPLHPHCSLSLDRSTCAYVPLSLWYFGVVPTNLFGLEVAHGAPLGLAGLCLLGPATAA